MKKIKYTGFFLLFILISTAYSDDKELFYMDVLNFYTPDSTGSRLDVYVEFPFDKLEFQKSKSAANTYSSQVDLSIEIRDNYNQSLVNKVYKEEITTPSTETQYLSVNSKILTENFYLKPGQYKIKVSAFEQSTQKSSTTERDVTIRDFLSDPITFSDVMVLSHYSEEKNKKSITPDISRNVSGLDTFFLFLFTYKNIPDSLLYITCTISNSKKEVLYTYQDTLTPDKGISFQNQLFIKIVLPNLNFDNYSAEITAAGSTSSSKISTTFTCVNLDFPMSLNNIDVLISQLQYIANEKEMDYLKAAKTDDEKRKRFLEFWKSKDPSPTTKRNEVMMEYYRRLNYANKHFTSIYQDGWKSDMGMVYIIFGMPSNVDRHPYEMETKPYEVWDYYDLNREFVFIDETGFGDYRLITPIYDEQFKIFK